MPFTNQNAIAAAARRHGCALLLSSAPMLAMAQATSPFMTGATSLQTNILAWLTPIAVILVMVLGAMAMANRLRSEFAERLRADYRARVEERAARSAAPEVNATGAQAQDLEQVRRQAREAWLQLRARETLASPPARSARETQPEPVTKEAEDDLTL